MVTQDVGRQKQEPRTQGLWIAQKIWHVPPDDAPTLPSMAVQLWRSRGCNFIPQCLFRDYSHFSKSSKVCFASSLNRSKRSKVGRDGIQRG